MCVSPIANAPSLLPACYMRTYGRTYIYIYMRKRTGHRLLRWCVHVPLDMMGTYIHRTFYPTKMAIKVKYEKLCRQFLPFSFCVLCQQNKFSLPLFPLLVIVRSLALGTLTSCTSSSPHGLNICQPYSSAALLKRMRRKRRAWFRNSKRPAQQKRQQMPGDFGSANVALYPKFAIRWRNKPEFSEKGGQSTRGKVEVSK